MAKQTDKQLLEKAIDIKGKKYVLVSDRVLYFNETYPNGSIITERLTEAGGEVEIIKATIYPDVSNPARFFTGYSQAKRWDWFINKTSALENAESSAVWRWLAFMWIGVIESIASLDEINKAENTAKTQSKKVVKAEHIEPEWPFHDETWYEKALKWTKFMNECMDELDFMKKIKNRVKEIWETMSEEQEKNLRIAYQNAKALEQVAQSLSTNDIIE